LTSLAEAAGIEGAEIRIDQAPNGVNLFMHIKLSGGRLTLAPNDLISSVMDGAG
jgi:hypothetical protein